jgi:hypothetical protein
MTARNSAEHAALAATRTLALSALAFTSLSLAPSLASAQVEARCPQGWSLEAPIAQAAEGQRPLVTCRKDPMAVGGLQLDAPVPQGSQEGRLAVQLLMAARFPPPEAMPTLRDETFGTIRGRVHEITAEGEGPGGTTTRISGAVALIPVGRGTVVLRAISTNARSTALAALRAFIPAIVGIDGSAPSWRVGLTGCPRPLARGATDGAPPNGMRLAGVCVLESEGKSVEVLESRLPIRNAAEARASADFFRIIMERTVGRAGGRVTLDEPVPYTVGAAQGFFVVVHASADTPEGQLRIDRGIAVIPLDNGGHAELVATVANAAAPTAVRSLVDALAANVKLDGSQVTGATSAAPAGDGGAAGADPGAGSSAPAQRERPAFDPNAPIPTFPTEERPRVAPQTAQKSACGCSTPGLAGSSTLTLAATTAMALATALRRRRRVAR